MVCCFRDGPACGHIPPEICCGGAIVSRDGASLGTSQSPLLGMSLSQLYLLAVPLHRPPHTPPWSLVMIYVLFVILGITQIAMRTYVKTITGHFPTWSTGLWLGLQLFQTLASLLTLSIIAGLHMAPPSVLARMVSPLQWHRAYK